MNCVYKAKVVGLNFHKVQNAVEQGDKVILVAEDNASQGGLLLYDEVIVSSPKDFKVGDKIS